MKTAIGAIIGILIIVAIVLFARNGYKAPTTADIPDTTKTTETQDQSQTQTQTQSMEQNTNQNSTGGLVTKIIKEGTGAAAKTGDTVSVNYTGKLTNGTVFDTNVGATSSHPTPFQFTLGQNRVIQGWEQGVLGMKVGEKRHLTIPASLGYGENGFPPVIPANATLEFDVELLAISHS